MRPEIESPRTEANQVAERNELARNGNEGLVAPGFNFFLRETTQRDPISAYASLMQIIHEAEGNYPIRPPQGSSLGRIHGTDLANAFLLLTAPNQYTGYLNMFGGYLFRAGDPNPSYLPQRPFIDDIVQASQGLLSETTVQSIDTAIQTLHNLHQIPAIKESEHMQAVYGLEQRVFDATDGLLKEPTEKKVREAVGFLKGLTDLVDSRKQEPRSYTLPQRISSLTQSILDATAKLSEPYDTLDDKARRSDPSNTDKLAVQVRKPAFFVEIYTAMGENSGNMKKTMEDRARQILDSDDIKFYAWGVRLLEGLGYKPKEDELKHAKDTMLTVMERLANHRFQLQSLIKYWEGVGMTGADRERIIDKTDDLILSGSRIRASNFIYVLIEYTGSSILGTFYKDYAKAAFPEREYPSHLPKSPGTLQDIDDYLWRNKFYPYLVIEGLIRSVVKRIVPKAKKSARWYNRRYKLEPFRREIIRKREARKQEANTGH